MSEIVEKEKDISLLMDVKVRMTVRLGTLQDANEPSDGAGPGIRYTNWIRRQKTLLDSISTTSSSLMAK